MRSLKRSGITALTAAIALSLGAIPLAVMAPSLLAGSPPLTISPALAPAGTLTLATAPNQGTVTWNGMSQSFTGGQQCKITLTPGSKDLLGITGSVGSAEGSAGFREGNIGVFEFAADGKEPANAAQCFRVDADSFTTSETLKLSLGGEVKDTFGALVAKTATVTLQAKSQGGTVRATMLRAVAQPGTPDPYVEKSWKLKSGAEIVLPALPVGEFKGIALSATNGGSFSLTAATFPLFSTADAVLDCTHPSITKGTTTATYIGAAGQACAGSVAVTLTSGANSAELLKPNSQVPNAEFVFDFVWKSPANTATPADPFVPRTKADFDGDGGLDGPTELLWCPNLMNKTVGTTTYPVVTNVNGNPAPAGVVDQAPNYPGPPPADTRQFACIVSQASSVSPSNELTVSERIYVFGDIKLLR